MRKRYAAEYKFDKIKRLDSLIADQSNESVIELARQASKAKKELNNTWRKRVNKNSGNLWNKKTAKAFAI